MSEPLPFVDDGAPLRARRHQTLSQAAHALRTPLASIIGFSELLLKREFDAAECKELAGIIHAQAGRMATLMNQVFELARLDAGGAATLRIAPTQVDVLLAQALEGIAATGGNARVMLDIAAGLPLVAADPERLASALGHALDNALRYSSPATPVLVRAVAFDDGATPGVLLHIVDQGSGMTPEQQARLFEPFYRGAIDLAPDGTGLGMAIFKETVELHRGVVELVSSPGAGTALTIRLPAAGGVDG